MSLEKYLRNNIKHLKPYASARDEFDGTAFVQLDANENPFETGLNRYPDPYQCELKSKIGEWKNVDADQIVLGNGSDELIDLLIRAFCEPKQDNVIGLKPSYGMYKVCCDINDVQYKEVELDDNFDFSADSILRNVNENTKLIFLCSPNNPSGNDLSRSEILKVLEVFNGPVIIDEAYIDFSEKKSFINTLSDFNQLVVLQTFSKSIGMAGIRLGMAFCSVEMVKILNKIKPPYNVNSLTQSAALEVISLIEDIKNRAEKIVAERSKLESALTDLKIVEKVFPSDANFLLVRFLQATQVCRYLCDRGVVVRDRSDQFNCQNCLRITVGTKEQNNELIKNLKAFEYEESTVY